MSIYTITSIDALGYCFCETASRVRSEARWLRNDEVHPDLHKFGGQGRLKALSNNSFYLVPLDRPEATPDAMPESIRPEIMEFARLMEQHMRGRETYCAPYMELSSYSVRQWLRGLLESAGTSIPSDFTAGLAADLGAGAMMLRNLLLKEAKENK